MPRFTRIAIVNTKIKTKGNAFLDMRQTRRARLLEVQQGCSKKSIKYCRFLKQAMKAPGLEASSTLSCAHLNSLNNSAPKTND